MRGMNSSQLPLLIDLSVLCLYLISSLLLLFRLLVFTAIYVTKWHLFVVIPEKETFEQQPINLKMRMKEML